MLTGGKWGDGWACPVCGGSNSGALLKCHSCEYKIPADDEIKEVMMSKPLTGIGYFLRIARAVLHEFRRKNGLI